MLTAEIVEATVDMTEAEAAQITRKIDLRLVTVAENWEAALAYILEAIERKAHLALGYPSPGAYIADKFGSTLSRLSVETRREVSQGLAEAGLSSRAIASVVDVSDRQVRIDVASGGKSLPTSTTGVDGKSYPREKQWRAPVRSDPEPEKLTPEQREALWPKVAEMAEQGRDVDGVNRELGMYSEPSRLRAQASRRGIAFPADKVLKRQVRIDSVDLMDRAALILETTAASLHLVDVHALPVERIEEWMTSMKASISALSKARRRIESAFMASDLEEVDGE